MLEQLFKKVLLGYQEHARELFAYDEFTSIITETLPEEIARAVGQNKYVYRGSVGQGNWAETPWVAILNRAVTTSTQNGYYVCYLVNPIGKYMYLSLAVGWTQFADKYPQKIAERRIKEYSEYLCAHLRTVPQEFKKGPIDLGAKHQLSKGYEQGQILSRRYNLQDLDRMQLAEDLNRILAAYDELTTLVGSDIENVDYEQVVSQQKLSDTDKDLNRITLVQNSDEALSALKNYVNTAPPNKRTVILKKAVRNPKIARLVKESKSYICELCGREPFIQKNGKPYAEADHIKPLGDSGYDSADNIRCLCAQCHAIVTHGSDDEIRKLLG